LRLFDVYQSEVKYLCPELIVEIKIYFLETNRSLRPRPKKGINKEL